MLKELELKDTEFVTKLVMERLEIESKENSEEHLFAPKSETLKTAIESIVSIEDSWEHKSADEAHTYGRKHAGEIIKLWSVPEKSAQVLENFVVLTGAKTILEIGTSAGFAALYLAQGAKQTGGTVHTIELLPEKAALARKNFVDAGVDNVNLIEAEAAQVLSNWEYGQIDLVFLDADKENYGKYLEQLVPLMPIGGIIVADNINDYGHMMEDYLQKVCGTHLPKTRTDHRVKSYYLAALDNGLLFTKKISD
jgi:predicted O-methyltransferase YrrM